MGARALQHFVVCLLLLSESVHMQDMLVGVMDQVLLFDYQSRTGLED